MKDDGYDTYDKLYMWHFIICIVAFWHCSGHRSWIKLCEVITDQLHVYSHKDVILKPAESDGDADHSLMSEIDDQLPHYTQVVARDVYTNTHVYLQLKIRTYMM